MDFIKAKVLNTQADIDALLSVDAEHWVGEALESYVLEDLKGKLVIVCEDGDVVVKDSAELFKDTVVLSVDEITALQYVAGRLFDADFTVAAFTLSKDSGFVWTPCNANMLEDGFI